MALDFLECILPFHSETPATPKTNVKAILTYSTASARVTVNTLRMVEGLFKAGPVSGLSSARALTEMLMCHTWGRWEEQHSARKTNPAIDIEQVWLWHIIKMQIYLSPILH